MSLGFEKIFLTCMLIGSAALLFGSGVLIGEYRAGAKLKQTATQFCGAKFDELTGEFAWIKCPPPAAEPAVVAPEPDPVEPVAPTEVVPSTATATPNEPVY